MPAKPKEPEFEVRTRIICHFPLNRQPNQTIPNQVRVIRRFVKYLESTSITGFTMSSLLDSVCTGFWRSMPGERFQEENVAVFAIDHPLGKNDPQLWAFTANIKREIQKLYKLYAGGKEQDVWIIVHTVDRLV